MPFEIDFLPVGDGEHSGDAIAMRFQDAGGIWRHVVIDGGYSDDGTALISHIDRYYDTNHLDLVLLTHADRDHRGGLTTVMSNFTIGQFAVHRLDQRGGSDLPGTKEVNALIALAEARGASIVEPFAGASGFGGILTVLGPSVEFFDEMISAQHVTLAAAPVRTRGGLTLAEVAAARARLIEVPALPDEQWFDEGEGTNPRNQTSAITLWNFNGHRVLLTGDAGVDAMVNAWDWLVASGLDASPPRNAQVPHHGSRRNCSTDMLDYVLGPVGGSQSGEAVVSVAPGSLKHPSPRVINAFARRKYPVATTAGCEEAIMLNGDGMPQRFGWSTAPVFPPLSEAVEG
ncbi:MAG: hypothetical protein JWQ18_26 [Conexibacter sp.]|nr:hypothetical protein [Conexibacter sp.]